MQLLKITFDYAKGKLAVRQVIPVKSKKVSLIDQHMWGGYEYDHFGNVLLDTKGNKDAIKAVPNHIVDCYYKLKRNLYPKRIRLRP